MLLMNDLLMISKISDDTKMTEDAIPTRLKSRELGTQDVGDCKGERY